MKIIDLLNKIANGEKVPKKIKCMNREYIYSKRTDEDFNYRNLKSGEYLSEEWIIENILNEEVEILEDTTEEIEEIDLKGYHDYGEILDTYKEKINELVRTVNKLNNTTYKAENCMTD